MFLKLEGFLILIIFCICQSAEAGLIRVGQGAGYDFQTITEALNAAVAGDTITVADGNYSLTSGEFFPLRMKQGVILKRESDDILPQIAGISTESVIEVENIQDLNTTIIDGFLISGGGGKNRDGVKFGGGIYLEGSQITIKNCSFTRNLANFGGGIYCENSSPILTNCIISENKVSGYISNAGGGMYCNNNSSPILINCSFRENIASEDGGGIFCYNSSLTLTNSSFSGNISSCGGSIYWAYSSSIIKNCTIKDNLSSCGGGMYCFAYSTINLINCIISGNTANEGGGIFCIVSKLSLLNCSISGNKGKNYGGIFCANSIATLTNCIVWGNEDDITQNDSSLTLDHCDIGDGDGLGTNANIATNPMFKDFLNGDFSLIEGSPCIDRGVDVGLSYNGTAPDIGAIESSFSGPYPFPKPCQITVGPTGNYNTITDALWNFNIPGTVMKIQESEYTAEKGEIFPLILYGVSLIGEESREGDYNITIIGDGDNSVILSGAIFDFNLCDLKITGGGDSGIKLLGSSPKINNCHIYNNSTLNSGGGLYGDNSSAMLTNCAITNNFANSEGGGLCFVSSKPILINCAIMNNSASLWGGGIDCGYDSSLILTNCKLSGNTAVISGGGMNWGANCFPKLTNCLFIGNRAGKYGGGIDFSTCSAILSDCTFIGNSAEYGGGIYCESTSPLLININFSGNNALYGGGMYCGDNASSVLSNCTFNGNTANYYGGGLYFYNSRSTLTNCILTGNIASGYYPASGGGMYCRDNSSPALTNCIVYRNIADYFGGGLFCYNSSATLTNCTFSLNSASSKGGAIYLWRSVLKTENSILWRDYPQEIRMELSSAEVYYCDVQGGHPGTGNINADPLFVDPNQDFHLQGGSPCIDTGTNEGAPSTDFDGEVRPNPYTGIADIGADEYYGPFIPSPTPTATFTNSPTSTPSLSPTPTYDHPPVALCGGYMDTRISASAGGQLFLLAIILDPDGEPVQRVNIFYQGADTGISLIDQGNGVFSFSLFIPANILNPDDRFLLELKAFSANSSSELFPFLSVKINPHK